MFEVGKLTNQPLKISKQLAAGSKSFKIILKTDDIDIDISRQHKKVVPKYPGRVKKSLQAKRSKTSRDGNFTWRRSYILSVLLSTW